MVMLADSPNLLPRLRCLYESNLGFEGAAKACRLDDET